MSDCGESQILSGLKENFQNSFYFLLLKLKTETQTQLKLW